MFSVIRTVRVLLFIMVALLSSQNWVQAEQLNNSVKDYLEHPDAYEDKSSKEKNEKVDQQDEKTVGVTFGDFARMIAALVFVVGLLYFLLKFINKRSMTYKRSQLVENLGGTSLGGNRSIQIVKAGNTLLIVGVGENIQLLKEIDNPEEYQNIISDHNNKIEQLIQPADLFSRLLSLKKDVKDEKKQPENFSLLLKSQLEDVKNGRKRLFEEIEKKGTDSQ